VPDDFSRAVWTRLAEKVLTETLGLRRRQSVVIASGTQSLPAAERLMMEALRLGIRPVLLRVPDWSFHYPKNGKRPSYGVAFSRPEIAALAASDGFVFIPVALDDEARWEKLPSAERRAWNDRDWTFIRVLASHSIKAVDFLPGLVNPESARSFDIDFKTWQKECIRASSIAASQLRKSARPLLRPLLTGKRLTITHPNGTHLELGLCGNSPIVDDGMVDAQDLAIGRYWTVFPGGQVVVALDGRTAEGCIVSNRPTHHPNGSLSEARWTFRKGRLVKYDFGKGRRMFEREYRLAGRERNRPAIFEVGLNPRIHDLPPVEDQERGVCSLLIGHNDDYGGRIQGMFRHTAILRGGSVLVDDTPLIRAGRW